MQFFQWLISNWPGVLSILSFLLGIGVIIANMAHRADVAASLQSVEDALKKIADSNSSQK